MPGEGCPHSITAMARSPECQAQLERGLCACARARTDFNKITPLSLHSVLKVRVYHSSRVTRFVFMLKKQSLGIQP